MRVPHWLLLVCSCVLLAGCGVKLSNPPPGTEFFKSLAITGDMRAGATLTADVGIAQHNPIDVAISCELRRSQTVLTQIGSDKVPLLPDGGPKATPVASSYSFNFTADQAGTYDVKCVTPSDQDNFIVKQFHVGPGAAPSPQRSG